MEVTCNHTHSSISAVGTWVGREEEGEELCAPRPQAQLRMWSRARDWPCQETGAGAGAASSNLSNGYTPYLL